MLRRSTIFLALPLLVAVSVFAGDPDTQEVSFDKPVQIPETVLPPGQYKIHLEDHLADRAIVRMTDPNGSDHYILTVPTSKLSAPHKGLIFFHDTTGAEAIHGWECPTCGKPLEFVYPKDEAVKLTAETGTPVMAYDPSYDKLPDNLTPADRKVVTLWLLSPKTVTPEGKGEGLTAAKLTAPKTLASAEPLPKKMPKTASSAFNEIVFGLVALTLGLFLARNRKVQPDSKTGFRIFVIAGATLGIVTGFAVPLVASFQQQKFYQPTKAQLPREVVVIPTLAPTVAVVDGDPDSEMARLAARNRRLEALVATLRKKAAGED